MKYKDICILLRAVGGKKGISYAAALRERGIPCFTQVDAEFFTANEVRLLLNVLRVVDNPEQDIALLSVMMSALFGFTADECAALRINCRKKSVYACRMQMSLYFAGRSAPFSSLTVYPLLTRFSTREATYPA